jgi:hypothetical protein
LGQVLVQFYSVLEHHNLVLLGPQQYLDATFTALRHNDAWNHRALFFNRECWLMLLGFPLDYHSSEYLQAAIGSFGRLIHWEEDRHNVTRTLLRVRVTSLEEVSQFIVFSEADGFVGDSWTVQCEIIQQNMLGGQAQDEDPIPHAPEDGQQLPLFFWSRSTYATSTSWPRPQFPAGSFGRRYAGPSRGQCLGEWNQWIENIQPDQQIPQPIQPDEQQLSNQHSGLSSDSFIGPIQDAPLQNGNILEVGPVMPRDGPALNVAPINGPQEVDGPVIQMDPLAVNAGQPPKAQDGGQNNNHFFHNLEMNFMFTQEWQPDPVFQMHLERRRSAQLYRIWANYFAPAGIPDISVNIAKKWAPFFLSNLLQPEAFN